MDKSLPQSTPDPLARSDRREWVLAALDQFEGRLLCYAQRLLGNLGCNTGDARDVVQFVFLRLCDQSPDEIDDRLAQWLYTVCRNRALDVLRASGREKANGKQVGRTVPTEMNAGGGHSPPYSREIDPADSVERAELHGFLRALVEVLPANQREAIDLWSDGFSYPQIAEITNQKEGHIRVLVHRGLKAVREHPRVRALVNEDAAAERRPNVAVGFSPRNTDQRQIV